MVKVSRIAARKVLEPLFGGFLMVAIGHPCVLTAQRDTTIITTGDSILIRLVDVELQAATEALARYLEHPVIISNIGNARVTIETPRPLARRDVAGLLKAVIESQNLEFVLDTAAAIYRVRQKEPVRPPVPVDITGGTARQAGENLQEL